MTAGLVPSSWDVQRGTLKDPNGKTIADWKKNKLSLWTYSPSFEGKVEKQKLNSKILSNPAKNQIQLLFILEINIIFGKMSGVFLYLTKYIRNLKKENIRWI